MRTSATDTDEPHEPTGMSARSAASFRLLPRSERGNYSELWRISPVYTKPNGKVDVRQLAHATSTTEGLMRPHLSD